MQVDEETAQLLRLLVPINGLPPSFQDQVLHSAELLKFKRRETVFKQGSRDEYGYYLLSGMLELYADDQLIKLVEGGTGPAFHPLAQLQPRQMSARAKTAVTVLRINRQLLDKLLSLEHAPPPEPGVEVVEMEPEGGGDDWVAQMLQSELFSRIPPINIQKLLASMETVSVKSGDVILRQGDPGDYYYILKKGRCEVTRQSSAGSNQVQLAELAAVTSFGEEALVADARRNATVRMLTDGELVRLTKENFVELIKNPLLKSLRFDQARTQVEGGAVWLDVRFPEEYQQGHLPNSLNIPLTVLRAHAEKLDRDRKYLTYCDTGSRSSVAAFLLTERGYDAQSVESGCMDQIASTGMPARTPAAATTVAPGASTPAPRNPPISGDSVEADVIVSSLKAELAKAKLQIEDAKRLKAEVAAAKRAAKQEAEDALRAERNKLEADAKRAADVLAEAKRIKETLDAQRREAEQEARKRHREQEARLNKLQAEAEQRLHEEEKRMQDSYRVKAEQLEQLLAERAKAESTISEERQRLQAESAQSKRMLEDIHKAMAARETQELTLRRKNEEEIAAERRKLEAVFAKNTALLEMAQREKAAAKAAKRAAAEEAEAMIEEYRRGHEEQYAAQQLQIQKQLKVLESERARLQAEMKKVNATRSEAEALLTTAWATAATARDRQGSARVTGEDARGLQAAADAADAQAQDANRILNDAVETQQKIQTEQAANQHELARAYSQQTELHKQLQRELDEWLEESDKAQSSTVGREWLKNHHMQSQRIKDRAEQARVATQSHDASLLSELEAQLGDPA
jgi:CRP-like cAMP-binding protein